ncbi:hypothetical protein LQE92_04365 [Lacrimispora sp. NSJ-141]|uniref:Uncharacterized protein n=1 Tax=Lientehia hominis TaxID=2897778 RepID=A0AAP2W9K8_9FIRM|nr:hypothetical protein [Lientehia hominis]MCD2491859.1 hypothetical protein [Lientehia hominis]
MKLDEIRTYKLSVEADGHSGGEGFLKEDTDLTISGGELLHAAVTCGIPEERLMTGYSEKPGTGISRRISLVEYSLEAQGEYLRKSDRILELDESMRSLISYYLGMFITKLVSGKVYGVDYLVPLQLVRLEQGQENLRYHGKRRRDMIGYREGTDVCFSVWEAIGRSNNSGKALKEGCKSAEEILTVNGHTPCRADSCMTYYGSRCLSVRVKTTAAASEGLEISFPPAAYFRAYYDAVYGIVRECYERESVRNQMVFGEERIEAEIPVSGGRKLYVGMPRRLFFALESDDEEVLMAADEIMNKEKDPEIQGPVCTEAYCGRDGVSVSVR